MSAARTCRLLLWSALSTLLLPLPGQAQTDFNRQIRPILSRHCTVCHGPDETARQADLRLDTREAATANLGGYAAIVPGDPDASEMIFRISSTDDPMPPAEHGPPLSPEEIRLLRQWIAEGARYQTHWAYDRPVRPAVPDGDPALHPIDRFVRQRVLEAGLLPNDPASPERLVRKVALDLTGLPAARHLIERFRNDPADNTWETIVDELLNDAAYGEHWASMWLDLGRYADTTGYAGDEDRTIWPWRDWLIRSLNQNKPFDQFTLEILAGDLLPDPTPDQRLATAFHRNTLNNNEGGTNDEEFRTIAVKDRVSTTMSTWMGLTFRCAECHSHKYDPISNVEYYRFLDFFNQTADADRPNESPLIELRPESLAARTAELDLQIADLQRQRDRQPPVWRSFRPHDWQTDHGTRLQVQPDDSILASGPNPGQETWTLTGTLAAETQPTGLRIELLPDPYHGNRTGRGADGRIVMTHVRVHMDGHPVELSAAAANYAQQGFGPENLIRPSPPAGDDPLGWAVQHEQQGFAQPRFAIVQFARPLQADKPQTMKVQLGFTSQWHHCQAGKIRLSLTEVENPVERFRRQNLDPAGRRIRQMVQQRNAPVRVPVLQELPPGQHRTTHVMKRGNFQNTGEVVSAAVPDAFHDFPQDAPRNRLGLARWLVHPHNPLTARVMVNRLWARLFGRGLVVTEEDFGTQGTLPSHPQLLDWLAVDFQENGWDIKRILKLMVMSRTYRQSTRASGDQLEQDPDNIWLARGPRVRLPAETIRDQALAVSGLLSRKMYGPPVYPPNPVKQVTNAFKGAAVWNTSTGEDRYRRSIYTFLKRSQPHPLFETFDISTRDVCSLRRIRTNTPLQSFMTLNDEAFVEAAQALATRMSGQPDPEACIARGLELALQRAADPQRVIPLMQLYERSLDSYRNDPSAAAAMLGPFADKHPSPQHPPLAALTVVANVILNLDEFLSH
jgi:hypothetical protein